MEILSSCYFMEEYFVEFGVWDVCVFGGKVEVWVRLGLGLKGVNIIIIINLRD